MAYVVMAYVVMAFAACPSRLHFMPHTGALMDWVTIYSYGLYSYGLCSNGHPVLLPARPPACLPVCLSVRLSVWLDGLLTGERADGWAGWQTGRQMD